MRLKIFWLYYFRALRKYLGRQNVFNCIIGHKRCAFCDDIEALARREDSHLLYDPKLHVLVFLKKLERLRQSI